MRTTGSWSLLILSTVFGCAGGWEIVEEPIQENGYHVVATGWFRYPDEDDILLTKDGPFLQRARIHRTHVDSGFSFTKKKIQPHHILFEVSEIVIDDIRSNPNCLGFRLLENNPAEISGYPGFRIYYRFQTDDGDEFKGMSYGLLFNKYFYELSYVAPELHYFAKDSSSFETIASKFAVYNR